MDRQKKNFVTRTKKIQNQLDTRIKREKVETTKFKIGKNSKYKAKIHNKMSAKQRLRGNRDLPVIFASAPLNNNFIEVSILGKKINTLVDTGSSLSCIKQSLLNTLDQDFISYDKSEYRNLKGIGGHFIDIKGTLPVKIGDLLFYQKFYIYCIKS